MSAIDRAEEDIRRGEPWLARQRLESLLNTTGYNPAVLRRLGEVCMMMNNELDAGRVWFASPATGPEVDRAIDVFVRHAGGDAEKIAGYLPRGARLSAIERYPGIVQERIEKLGLAKAITRRAASEQTRPRSIADRVLPLGCLVALVAILFVLVCGLYQIGSWIF
jgi:hypothetical protein